MSIKKILLLATCLSLGACTSQDSGQRYANGRPHPLADNSSVYASNYGHQDRENCQMYERDVNKMAYVPRCMKKYLTPAPEPVAAYVAPAPAPAPVVAAAPPVQETTRLLPIIRSYPVYFAFDKSSINVAEIATLDAMSSDMLKYHPPQVTVTGHTDRAGPVAYNQALSERRAQAVSRELTSRGISHQIIDEQARGETDSAVVTRDGVSEQANRRAMIDFRGEETVKIGAQ
jgi:outer membrane protein OmpA-like peptidoglycan-associated protein